MAHWRNERAAVAEFLAQVDVLQELKALCADGKYGTAFQLMSLAIYHAIAVNRLSDALFFCESLSSFSFPPGVANDFSGLMNNLAAHEGLRPALESMGHGRTAFEEDGAK